MPTGPGKREQPMTDEASDMIGRLLIEGKLSISQEQAARRFQEAHTAYQASIGLSGYKSCLAGGSGAYDSSDGDPAAEAAYRNIRNRIGAIRSARLQVEVAKLAHERPMDLGYLKGCLDMLGGG